MGRIVGSNMLVLLETWSAHDSRMTQDECMMKASHDYVVVASFSNCSVESVESVESLSGSGFRKEYSCAIERFNLEAWWNRQDHPKPSKNHPTKTSKNRKLFYKRPRKGASQQPLHPVISFQNAPKLTSRPYHFDEVFMRS